MLISRFLLNLRQADNTSPNSSALADFSLFSMPGFRVPMSRSVVGNLGQPLEWRVSEDASVTANLDRFESEPENIQLDELGSADRNRRAEAVPLFVSVEGA